MASNHFTTPAKLNPSATPFVPLTSPRPQAPAANPVHQKHGYNNNPNYHNPSYHHNDPEHGAVRFPQQSQPFHPARQQQPYPQHQHQYQPQSYTHPPYPPQQQHLQQSQPPQQSLPLPHKKTSFSQQTNSLASPPAAPLPGLTPVFKTTTPQQHIAPLTLNQTPEPTVVIPVAVVSVTVPEALQPVSSDPSPAVIQSEPEPIVVAAPITIENEAKDLISPVPVLIQPANIVAKTSDTIASTPSLIASTPLIQQPSLTSQRSSTKFDGEKPTLESAPSQKKKAPNPNQNPNNKPKQKKASVLIPTIRQVPSLSIEYIKEFFSEGLSYPHLTHALIVTPESVPALKVSTMDHALSHAKNFKKKERPYLEGASFSRSRSSHPKDKDDPKVLKIQMTEAGYKMKKAEGDEKKIGEVQMVLNKLSEHNIDKLAKEIQALDLDSMELFQQIIMLLFNKAVDEPNFAGIYAKFCALLKDMSLSIFPQSQTEKIPVVSTDGTAQPIVVAPPAVVSPSNVTFKKLIVTEVQSSFQRNPFTTLSAQEVLKLPENEQLEIFLSRKRYLGTIKLLGELYRAGLLSAKHIYHCFDRLVENITNEEALEALCNLFRNTVFLLVDQHFRANKIVPAIDGSYDISLIPPEATKLINTFKQSSTLRDQFAPRMRYMMMDTVDDFVKKLQHAGAIDKSVARPRDEKSKPDSRSKKGEETSLSNTFSSRSDRGGKDKGGKKGAKDDRSGNKGGKSADKAADPKKNKFLFDDKKNSKQPPPVKKGGKPVKADFDDFDFESKEPVIAKVVQVKPKATPKAPKKAVGGKFAAFDDFFDGEDVDEDEEEEDVDEDEEEEEEDVDEDEEDDTYSFTNGDRENLSSYERKIVSSNSEYCYSQDIEDINYTFKEVKKEQFWLIAYQALFGVSGRNSSQIDSIYNSGILVVLPPTPEDWLQGVLRLAPDFSEALEDKPIFLNVVAKWMTQLIQASRLTFDKSTHEAHFVKYLGQDRTKELFEKISE